MNIQNRAMFMEDTSFSDVVAIVHRSIDCANIKTKPVLAYRFTNDSKATPSCSLKTEDDWKAARKDMLGRLSRMKRNSKEISLVVTIPDELVRVLASPVLQKLTTYPQYLPSLAATKKMKKASGSATEPSKTRGKKAAPILRNLNLGSDDEEFYVVDEQQDPSFTEKEKSVGAELDKALRGCRLHPERTCKIYRLGNHATFSFHQLNAWAVALVCITLFLTLSS